MKTHIQANNTGNSFLWHKNSIQVRAQWGYWPASRINATEKASCTGMKDEYIKKDQIVTKNV